MKEPETHFLREEGMNAPHRIREVVVEHHATLLAIEGVVIVFLVGRWMEKVLLKRKFIMFILIGLTTLVVYVDLFDWNVLHPER